MNTLTATFTIVTPMFLGGADRVAETIRPAGVKGALRFWWRAINWARCLNEKGQDEVKALRHLHAEEARLFGIAAAEDGSGGQGVFLLQVTDCKNSLTDQPFSPLKNGQLYLLGMGLAAHKKGESKCIRNAINKDGSFKVKLLFRPRPPNADTARDVQQIADALLLFGLIGALGSRARHGLGSVAITEWTGTTPIPKTEADYKETLAKLLGATPTERQPPFTAFSRLSRIDVSPAHADALKLLEEIGQEQQMYRSFGRNGLVNGKPVKPNFKDDHDLIADAIEGKNVKTAPRRAVFGLPHNYFFSSTKASCDVNWVPPNAKAKRENKEKDKGVRASPLLLHIHPLNGKFHAVHTLLPAQFLPANASIRITPGEGKKRNGHVDVPPNPDWQIIRTYLSHLSRFTAWDTIHGSK